MKHLIAGCILVLFGLPPSVQSTEKATIALGGPRKVVAEVVRDGDDLIVEIGMLPIRTFDNATNLRLNRDKGRQYAQAALAKFLFPKAKGQVTFTLSGATVEKASLEGKQFRLTMRVPRNGVALKEVVEKPAKAPTNVASNSVDKHITSKTTVNRPAKINLFEVKGDYEETGRLLAETFKTSIPVLPPKANEDQRMEFYRAIADLEEQANKSFDAFVTEMRRNKLLLAFEADELTQQVESDRTDLMAQLKKLVDAATPSQAEK